MAYGQNAGAAWTGAGAWQGSTVGLVPASLGARLGAYIIDLVAIFALAMLIGFLIGVVGLVTFGLTWPLYLILLPMTALLYSAVTIGGPAQGTLGMRAFGIRVVDAETGGRVGGLLAALHALLFYLAAGTFLIWVADIAIGLFRVDRRLGHDLLVAVALVRR